MKKKPVGVLGLSIISFAILIHVLPARAIPCSSRPGLTGSVACMNGVPGDKTLGYENDKAFDLKTGNYFGFNDWIGHHI